MAILAEEVTTGNICLIHTRLSHHPFKSAAAETVSVAPSIQGLRSDIRYRSRYYVEIKAAVAWLACTKKQDLLNDLDKLPHEGNQWIVKWRAEIGINCRRVVSLS